MNSIEDLLKQFDKEVSHICKQHDQLFKEMILYTEDIFDDEAEAKKWLNKLSQLMAYRGELSLVMKFITSHTQSATDFLRAQKKFDDELEKATEQLKEIHKDMVN